MKKQQKCYIYTRVSTSMQVDGYSLDAQKDKLRKYADYQEMSIVGEYPCSDNGRSPTESERRQMERWICTIWLSAGKWQVCIWQKKK